MTNIKQWVVLVGALLLGFCQFALAEPIKIGVVVEMSGANAEYGNNQLNGIRLAVDEINRAGGVLNRPLQIVAEDNQSSNPGSVLAFSKIAATGKVSAMITPIRSSQILAMMPGILKTGIPTMVGGTDYTLTHAKNPWIFRGRPHDGYSAKAIADFGVNTLQKKKWAIVYSTEAFGVGGKNHLTESLKALGITPTIILGIRSGNQDMSIVLKSLKQSGADIMVTYIAASDAVATFAIESRKANIDFPWISSPSAASASAIRLGGNSLFGVYSITDYFSEANSQAQDFNRIFKQKHGSNPDLFSSWAYDAVHILALAIKQANSTQPKLIRNAILKIQDYKGVLGTHRFDQYGDALHGYNIVRNVKGNIVFIKRIDFQP